MKKTGFALLILLLLRANSHAQWIVETWAGTGANVHLDTVRHLAGIRNPWGLATDVQGNIYFSDNAGHCIRKVDAATGIVYTFAGQQGQPGFEDGTALQAQFSEPVDLFMDAQGLLWVTDFANHAVRRIDSFGNVTTVAGTGAPGYTDTLPELSQFSYPRGIVVNAAGEAFVADSWTHRIRKITPTAVTTFAGGGSAMGVGSVGSLADGNDTTARFYTPCGLSIDPSGNLYLADAYNHRIRKITPAGAVTTLAGSTASGTTSGSFADGPALSAQLNIPTEVLWKDSTQLIFSEVGNRRVRSLQLASDSVNTLAGTGASGANDGPALSATFNAPRGLVWMNDGLLIADYNNRKIRLLTDDPALAVKPLLEISKMKVWPVPFSDFLQVQLPEANGILRMIDVNGNQVMVPQKVTTPQMNLQIEQVSAGTYLLLWETGGKITAIRQVLKQ